MYRPQAQPVISLTLTRLTRLALTVHLAPLQSSAPVWREMRLTTAHFHESPGPIISALTTFPNLSPVEWKMQFHWLHHRGQNSMEVSGAWARSGPIWHAEVCGEYAWWNIYTLFFKHVLFHTAVAHQAAFSPGVFQASAELMFIDCREQMHHNEIYLSGADFSRKNHLIRPVF